MTSFNVVNGTPTWDNGFSTTLLTSATADRVLTLPNTTGTIVNDNNTTTLTNKTLSSNTNTITARELWVSNGTSSVSTFAATAPTTGQVLTATASNTATWQNILSAEIFSGVDTIGNIDVSAGWTDIPLDTEHKKTSGMTHTASSAEVTITVAGTYQITGYISTAALSGTNSSGEGRLMRNTGSGYVEVAGTRVNQSSDSVNEDDRNTGSFTINLDVTAGTSFKLQAERATGAGTIRTISSSGLSINTMGAQGGIGPIGPVGSGSNIIVRDETVAVPNTPHSIFNFTGNGVAVTDAGSGVANIDIGGAFTTSTITYIGSASNGGTNLSSITINVPGGTTRDMAMICHLTVRSNVNSVYGDATPPSGWKQISIQTNTDNFQYWRTMFVFAKWATDSEPSSYTWTNVNPSNNFVCGGISSYSGVAAFNIINAEASQATPNSLSHDVPAITTTVPNTMLIGYVSYASCATSWSLTGGTTQSFIANSATPPQVIGEGCVAFRKFQATIATVGGPGAFTATASNDSDNGLTDLLALTPAFNIISASSVGSIDIGATNATAINMGNQNASTNMYNLTTSSGYPTNVALTVNGGPTQIANIIEIKTVNGSLVSGVDQYGRFMLADDTTINIPTPIGGIRLFARYRAGRNILAQMGTGGVDFAFQPNLWSNKINWYSPQGNGTVVTVMGFGNVATGTVTTRNCTSTNFFNSLRRIGYSTATTAGSSAGTRHGAQQFWCGNAPGLGGFYYVARFGISSAATVSTQRSFVGLLASTTALGNTNPSANTSIAMLGFGVDSTDSQWTFMHGNGTSIVKDTLTGSFPARDLSVSMFECRIYCKPNFPTIYYSLEVLNGGSLYEGTATTTLPPATTFLSPQIWTNNGTTALACAIDIVGQYIESDN